MGDVVWSGMRGEGVEYDWIVERGEKLFPGGKESNFTCFP